jgi:hypothetical protein
MVEEEMMHHARTNIVRYVKKHMRCENETFMATQSCMALLNSYGPRAVTSYDKNAVHFQYDFFVAMEMRILAFYSRVH